MNFNERLKAAVSASAAPVPEDFLHTTRQMIDHLPRKERIIVRNKLSFGLVLAIILCMLTLTAVAAVLLTGQELVETEVLPMAIGNDTSTINDTFTNEELAHIVALAEENGIKLSDSILRALEKGEGYWEEEVIMSLAKAQFGPYPGQWTLEEQYWFEETLVTIGFQDFNDCLIPSPVDLTYEEAYAKAVQYLADEGWVPDPAILEDRTKYSLWRTYQCVSAEAGGNEVPEWNFIFDPKDINLPTLSVLMNREGGLENIGRMPGMAEAVKEGSLSYYQLYDMFYNTYGTYAEWSPETFIAFKTAVDSIDSINLHVEKAVLAFQATEFILPPEGSLTREEASGLAQAAVGRSDIKPGGAACIMDGSRAFWKIMLYEKGIASWKVEVDCMTGEVLNIHPADENRGAWQFYVPMSVEVTIPTPSPDGNG